MLSLPKPDLGRFWTVPNVLSLVRMVLVIPIAVFLWRDGPLEWLLGLVILVILTDWFDGRIARWTGTVSDWGKVIDPVADKFAAILTVTALTFRPTDPHLPLWFFGIVVGRDLAILLGGIAIMRRSGQIVVSAWAGKAASLWLALTILSVILRADPPLFKVCLWMTTGLLLLSFVVYIVRYGILFYYRSPPSESGPSANPSEPDSSSKKAPAGTGARAV